MLGISEVGAVSVTFSWSMFRSELFTGGGGGVLLALFCLVRL
jgi:hypothetical protein